MTLVFLSAAIPAAGRDSLYHSVSGAASAGYNLPSHGYYRGHNPAGEPIPANTSVHLKYGFGFQGGTRLGDLYPDVTQGVGLAGLTFYSPSLMGTPVVVIYIRMLEFLISPLVLVLIMRGSLAARTAGVRLRSSVRVRIYM